MATFEGLSRKTRERTIDVRLPGVDEDWRVVVRATSAIEDAAAIAFAIGEAKKAGAKPEAGDPVYDPALWAFVVATAYLDVDSPEDKRGTAFPGGAPKVLDKLSTESIAYLFQEQQRWQEEVSPSYKARSSDELVEICKRIALEGGDFFFGRLSPSTQVASARFMAGLLATSLVTTWPSGSPTAASTASSSRSQPKPTRSRPATKPPKR